jgi:hypothetical protein
MKVSYTVFCRSILNLEWDLLKKFGHSDEGGSTFSETSRLYEICPGLGYYAAWSGNSLPTFGDNIWIPPSVGQEVWILDFLTLEERIR